MNQLGPLVDVSDLGEFSAPIVICDVRWYLDGRSGRDAYRAGHLPGAIFVDLDAHLAGPPGRESGRHPFPDSTDFAATLGGLGIGPTDRVVAYDDVGGMVAGRLVWMLRILGQSASLLDGGLDAWAGPLATGETKSVPVECPERPWPDGVLVDMHQVAGWVDRGILLDARGVERYLGDTEPVDSRAGHIPGARNAPFVDNLTVDGRFHSADQLRECYAALGVVDAGEAVVYCGSGVSACHNLLAMEQAGLGRGRLYVGSWSQWSASDRPAAVGPEPAETGLSGQSLPPRSDQRFGRGSRASRVLARVLDAAALIGCRLPAPLAHTLAVVGGNLEWALRPTKRRQLAGNLARAIGEVPWALATRRLVRREVVNEARRSADLLWALGSPEEFLATVELDGVDYVHQAVDRGRGVVLAGPHMGGWELATPIPREILNLPTTAVVSDDWLAWAIEHARVGAGLKLMYDTDTSLRAVRRLEAGEALLVIGDNALGHQSKTLRVRLLDGTVALPRGIVRLSRLCQSPIVSFYVLPHGPRRWRVRFDEPIDPPVRQGGDAAEQEVLQQVADRWSRMIRLHPEHWWANFEIPWESEK